MSKEPLLASMNQLTLYSIRFYLNERFRLAFEDAGLEEVMDEDAAAAQPQETNSTPSEDEQDQAEAYLLPGLLDDNSHSLDNQIRTLDGDLVEDEFTADAINYQILLKKIDELLDRLKLDA